MLDPHVSETDLQQTIAAAIAQLRQLNQHDRQAHWRTCLADLSAEAATNPDHWSTWTLGELNHRHHIAWAKGYQTLWLGQQLVVPETLQSYPTQGMVARLALHWWAEQAEIFVNGQQVQAGDLFDCFTRILLCPSVTSGDTFNVAIRLVSPGHDHGALVKSVLILESAELESVEPGFIADEWTILQSYLTTFAPASLPHLAAVVEQIPWSVLPDRLAFDQAMRQLQQQIQPLATPIQQRQIQMLGHAHLDMAWLWPVSDTWTAAERTFKSVLSLQAEFLNLTFCHSTPALYAWIEEHRPELFQAIQQQVAISRWELVGGLWIEPELNIIDGESLVRQVLYGQHYMREKFGSINRIAWLPDSFGFCWQLPQILKQGGIEFFVTQKLRWNDTTQFPHELFWWQAPDGTRLFSVMSALIGQDVDPIKMANYAWEWEHKTNYSSSLWLPGVGDHGGGPTRDMLEVADRWQRSQVFPRLTFTTAWEYLQQLRQTATTVDDAGLTLPVWNDELYLEFHRGCYTTHADQKRWNRHCEGLLYQAELYAAIATLLTGQAYPKTELEQAWKNVLFNQFHDILPGSSIPEVFVDANQAWEAANQIGTTILEHSLDEIVAQIALPEPPHPDAQPLVIFNPLNWQRSEVVAVTLPKATSAWQICNDQGHLVTTQLSHRGNYPPMLVAPPEVEGFSAAKELLFLADIPSVGYRMFWLCPTQHEPEPLEPENHGYTMEHELLRVVIDPQTGNITSLLDLVTQKEVLSAPGNQLQSFQDQGQYWDAWNIDPEYAQHPLPPAQLKAIRWLESGSLRQRIRVVRSLGQSMICQDYVLEAGSAVLKIETTVDWQEQHVLLKAAFPFIVEADYASYETACAVIQRTTKPIELKDKAKWEVPALRWADISEANYGVSLLNDCKYGYDSQPNQLRLTLLRSSVWPDEKADRGFHQFTYAIYPHVGDWKAAQTVRRGYELNHPLRLWLHSGVETPTKQLPPIGCFLDLQAEHLVLMALKQSENALNAWILRCYEGHGQAAQLHLKSDLGLKITHPVNLLEDPTASSGIDQLEQTYHVSPWTISSFVAVQEKT
jgi:alpha-mannosidase